MEEAKKLKQQQYLDLKWELFREEMVNDQFKRFKEVHEGKEFAEVLGHYFVEGEKVIDELSLLLDQPFLVFDKVYLSLCKLRGAAASLGAEAVVNTLRKFQTCCDQRNADGCLVYMQQLRSDFYHLKNKLESLLKIEEQIISTGGTI